MAKDESKTLCTSNVLLYFFFTLFLLLITICTFLTLHLFRPFVILNHLYFPNAITSYIYNVNCTDKDVDEALFQRATSVTVAADDYCRKKKGMLNCDNKVAFMFMTKEKIPLLPLWERFFEGHKGKFSIYVHVPSEIYEEPQESSVFQGRRIPSKPVEWGKPSMVDAERRLLANALLDPLNQRFVLLSESCIPLYNFSIIYDYLIQSNLSFIGSFDDPKKSGRGRYNHKMSPTISLADWRKGSQWFEVHRELANVIISDCRYYPLFVEYCQPPCYMDEHYIPTLITKLHPSFNGNRSLTWTNWSKGGSHPAMFRRQDVSAQLIEGIRRGKHCMYNGSNSSVCFLFARKFDASSLEPLMHLLPVLLEY
ncbi:hypothetical protein LUZ63_005225 [Rhynchospora breviuscula]|uniref:Glycosyl transferase, family 14 n=1 Tax=Rhynchospora breviuscula TaxID=2022672 RepID=A0A9Q0CMF9_9POAL|nr:hypothetical protein LUZ63_005225 [Rhynchospora breviuscula]